MRPLIAITPGEVHNQLEPWSPVTYGQSYTYIEAIEHAGGTPFIIPLTKDEAVLQQLYNLADGIVFAGGNDPDPALYGEVSHPTVADASPFRDHVDMQLLRWALRDKKPLLGICRGMQLLNILQGGSLYQHLPEDFPEGSDHNSSTKRETLTDIAHVLRVEKSSKLGAIFASESIGTNTHHHQGIKTLGEGLIANAWSEDGLIEGLEMTNDHFAIGVQSHPESLEAEAEPRWQKFFSALVIEAKR